MTDEDVEDLYRTLATRLAVPFLNHEHDPLPPEVDGDILAILWRNGYVPAFEKIVAEGATQEQAERAKQAAKTLLGVIEEHDLVPIPPDLAAEIAADLATFLNEEPDGSLRRLDEKHVDWVAEGRVEIYFNEPKHRGCPHVAVVLADGKISVSLDDPPVVLTPHGYRGEAAAQKLVAKYRVRLMALWDQTRPTTQQLNPVMAKAPSKKKRRRSGSR